MQSQNALDRMQEDQSSHLIVEYWISRNIMALSSWHTVCTHLIRSQQNKKCITGVQNEGNRD